MPKKSYTYQFPVGNGDMTLLVIVSGGTRYTVLIDMNIREFSNQENDNVDNSFCDVLAELRNLLETDSRGRLYVDVLVLTHPDNDHIRGFEKYFHVGAPSEYTDPDSGDFGKIFVREMWSSPIVFRRRSKNHTLCDDAVAFRTEAKRRVKLYRENGVIGGEGDRIRLIGLDSDGKTDDIMGIVYEEGDAITTINEQYIPELQANVLAPLSDDEYPDGAPSDKNQSSIVMQWNVASPGYSEKTNQILMGGDADVTVWEILYEKYKDSLGNLEYQLLIAPHHCSWHTISYDSYSNSDNPVVSENAIKALSQCQQGAVIISSSETIKDDDNDPPNHQAMQEYKKILKNSEGDFRCLADNKPNKKTHPEVLSYRLTADGLQEEEGSETVSQLSAAIGMGEATRVQIPHGCE